LHEVSRRTVANGHRTTRFLAAARNDTGWAVIFDKSTLCIANAKAPAHG
jgi:hypothetical protein